MLAAAGRKNCPAKRANWPEMPPAQRPAEVELPKLENLFPENQVSHRRTSMASRPSGHRNFCPNRPGDPAATCFLDSTGLAISGLPPPALARFP